MIYYATLIISKEPINLPEDLSADPNVQHLVSQKFKMGTDINFFPGHNHSCKIEKSAPEYCNEVAQLFRGRLHRIQTAVL
ncbi:MAG: hypothetical protein UR65_C0079G0003 [Candidatus Moranbacteria bacterium GW2011_GWE2_35_164]|nr:MAG: hypothetical protein UR65_C0079G0003 [Candidatus Moranbacteria bacterium GW2011_GWE2_35_164]